MRYYPRLRDVPQRWVLVDAGPRILAEVPRRLADYTTNQLRGGGVEILNSSTLASVEPSAITLSDGTHVETETVVWTAGVTANPLVSGLGLPLDERGRIRVDSELRVEGHPDLWALGDSARVPNAATPGQFDPPTCQHALHRPGRSRVRSVATRRPTAIAASAKAPPSDATSVSPGSSACTFAAGWALSSPASTTSARSRWAHDGSASFPTDSCR